MKPGLRRQPSAMLTVRVCQALRAYAERKKEAERSQLRAALIERRAACVIYVKGSYEPARPAARGAVPDPPAGHADPPTGTRAQRPVPLAEYEPEAG
jgi:hypothetical protein